MIPKKDDVLLRMKESAQQDGEQAYEFKDEILEMSRSQKYRRDIRQEVVKNRDALVSYLVLAGARGWDEFLAELYANRVPTRELDAIKRIVRESHEEWYREVEEELYADEDIVVVERVRSVTYDADTRTLTYRIS